MCYHVFVFQNDSLVWFESWGCELPWCEVFSCQNEQRIQIQYGRLCLPFVSSHTFIVNLRQLLAFPYWNHLYNVIFVSAVQIHMINANISSKLIKLLKTIIVQVIIVPVIDHNKIVIYEVTEVINVWGLFIGKKLSLYNKNCARGMHFISKIKGWLCINALKNADYSVFILHLT